MSIIAGVISYLPYDSAVRAKRIEASRQQLTWIRSIYNDIKIIFVAQNYNEEELPEDCECVWFEDGIGAGSARNVILGNFYKTDYDWLLLLDDDTTAYPYYEYDSFLKDVAENPDKFKKVDAISAVEPEYHAYKKLNYQDRANLTHYKFEPRELNSGSATSIIRNIKKYYGTELYFPSVDANKGEGREDMEFLFSWLKGGYNWYTMDTWIRKSLCFDKSSIFGYNVDRRNKVLMDCLDNICKRYKDDGLQRETNGKITWKNFNNRYNKSEKVLYIEREKPIVFEENVIPKTTTHSKKLF